MTNNHVISLAATQRGSVEVTFSDRQRVPARIVGRDTKTDLAVIKVDGVDNLTVASLGDSSDLRIGQEVVAFGSPLGLDRTVTSGIVSATGRAVPLRPDKISDTDAVIDAIQTDAAITPATPWPPRRRRREGDRDQHRPRRLRGGSFGLGFAIPIDEAREVAQELIRDGRATHAQIGVPRVRSATTACSARRSATSSRDHRRVGGLREGDVVTEFDGRPIGGADELTVAARTATVGRAVPFSYWRDGRTFTGTITPAAD